MPIALQAQRSLEQKWLVRLRQWVPAGIDFPQHIRLQNGASLKQSY
jgi:hypothetical protein